MFVVLLLQLGTLYACLGTVLKRTQQTGTDYLNAR